MKKFTIYDNENNVLFETNDMNEINHFIDYNLESSELLHLHRENNLFIMYFHNYTIFYKISWQIYKWMI